MERIKLSGASVAGSLTGYKSNATGATWTLTANDAADSLAHLVTIRNDSTNDHTGKTALLTGTDANGRPLTETLGLPNNAATVTSVNYFLTLTSIVPSATIGADTMDVGWSATSSTAWHYPINAKIPSFQIGFGCRVVTGTPTYSMQHSWDGTAWFDNAVVTGQTVSLGGSYLFPVAIMRLKFSAAGTVSVVGIQAGP